MAKLLQTRPSAVILLLTLLAAPFNVAADDNSTNFFGPATALTTRYWDCCKPSCTWPVKADYVTPPLSCDIHDQPLKDGAQGSSCGAGGTAYACTSNSPWAINDTFSYGFVGAYLKGGDESTWCGACYYLNFTSDDLKGKSMIVQATNTDYDTTDANVFTFGIPGGNTSYAGACATQFGVSNATFGTENVGLSSRDQCDQLPTAMKAGCQWRFDWFKDAKGPSVQYTRVQCPQELINVTGGLRKDDKTFLSSGNSTGSMNAAPGTSLPLMTTSTVFVLTALWILFA